jgi:hypothetical protein
MFGTFGGIQAVARDYRSKEAHQWLQKKIIKVYMTA